MNKDKKSRGEPGPREQVKGLGREAVGIKFDAERLRESVDPKPSAPSADVSPPGSRSSPARLSRDASPSPLGPTIPAFNSNEAPPKFWRSLEEFSDDDDFREKLHREFPGGASFWPDGVSRRDFLRTMGASLALAGLAGCNRLPSKKIVPYVSSPEAVVPGRPSYYTSVIPSEGFGRGILVESHLGRPTKIEGNPAHPESLGATDAMTQAAVLSLYDPDRSRLPREKNQPRAWSAFENAWLEQHRVFQGIRGAGLALLTEPATSPTFIRGVHTLLDRFPQAKWYQHTPLARYDQEGVQLDFDFTATDIIFSIGSDFLHRHPSALRYTRAFTSRRRMKNGELRPNRFYALEATPSITGTMADHRLPASPSRQRVLLGALAQALGFEDGSSLSLLRPEEQTFITSLARDLHANGPRALCLAGAEEEPEIQRWALALNSRLGSLGQTVRFLPAMRSDGDPRSAGDLSAFAKAADRGEVAAVLIVGTNPAYTAPVDLRIAEKLGRIPHSFHLGLHFDETAAVCKWHLPESHFLESWGDLRGFDGSSAIQQPLIEPLYGTRSAEEWLAFLESTSWKNGYDLVRETWQAIARAPDFEVAWTRWLMAGRVEEEPRAPFSLPSVDTSFALDRSAHASPSGKEEPTLLFRPDSNLLDGRWGNNAWLQELPRPLSRLVWDNAALVSPSLSTEMSLENGDVLVITRGEYVVQVPVWIMPGQSDSCVTFQLGYGRTRAGEVGNSCGFDAYAIRTSESLWTAGKVALRKAGHTFPLVSTQQHFMMEGRDLVRVLSVAELSRENGSAEKFPSLYPQKKRSLHAWAMSIDLSTCIGCSACVAACQAENNSPVVGKDQVARGREMHWLRVDRYFQGDVHHPRFVHQPVPCMHCENAPCEIVCPVAATVHSSEGLNDMIYNRCVGTRYCSNNCPYKVRRFNFFDYREPAGSPVYLQKNPDVTIRERGVMEKCTYCVQRINAGRIAAERENRPIRDGEIRTACQQVCPAEAIVFGDLADPESLVFQRKSEKINYGLLAELNTAPRTTYLAKIVNPAEPLLPASA